MSEYQGYQSVPGVSNYHAQMPQTGFDVSIPLVGGIFLLALGIFVRRVFG